jgi:hypothetical protein
VNDPDPRDALIRDLADQVRTMAAAWLCPARCHNGLLIDYNVPWTPDNTPPTRPCPDHARAHAHLKAADEIRP